MAEQHSKVPARILVVDDEAEVRKLFTEVIAPYSAEVVTAAGPREAEELLRSECFNLVITDLMMGGKGDEGLGILKTVKETQPNTPVILMTAYGSDEVLDRTFHQGALSYLEKPVLIDDIFRALDSLGIPRRQKV